MARPIRVPLTVSCICVTAASNPLTAPSKGKLEDVIATSKLKEQISQSKVHNLCTSTSMEAKRWMQFVRISFVLFAEALQCRRYKREKDCGDKTGTGNESGCASVWWRAADREMADCWPDGD